MIENTLYGSMQKNMVPQARQIEFGSGTPSLLDQMDQFIDPAHMQNLAKNASDTLRRWVDGPAEKCDENVRAATDVTAVSRVSSGDARTDSIIAAALLMTCREHRLMTPVEKAQAAIEVLSVRYAADW